MKNIIERLKSPVVILQLIAIIVTVATYFYPDCSDSIQVIATAVTGAISIIAGLNNPTDRNKF